MAISPPKWAKNAVATLRGWVVGNELVKAQRFTQEQVDEYRGVIPPKPVEEPVAVVEPVAPPAPVVTAALEPAGDFSTMTKAQLVEYAASNNIEINPAAKKADILEAIKSAG